MKEEAKKHTNKHSKLNFNNKTNSYKSTTIAHYIMY